MSKTKRPRHDAAPTHNALARILDTPQLAQVVPRLQPQVLHRVVQTYGLEDCGELLALATPEQLAGVFDLDLWRAAVPGADVQFDADRFGVWLEVLVESGADAAARIVAQMDVDLLAMALAKHVRVFDEIAVTPFLTTDGDKWTANSSVLDEGVTCEVGGYAVIARGTEWWDAIVALLIALDAGHHDYFHRMMRGCRSQSNHGFELDELHDLLDARGQAEFDVAFDRERRRETQGYVTPPQARAFLKMARQFHPGSAAAPPDNPVARAYFRALAQTEQPGVDNAARRLIAAADSPPAANAANSGDEGVAAVVEVLVEAGVLPPPPRALLDEPRGGAPRLARIQRHLQKLHDADPGLFSTRSQELAYLANTIVAGCSIQARPITEQEASDAALSVCNLGLENWPSPLPGAALPDDFLVGQDLVGVFQNGWTILYKDVCMHAAEELIAILAELRSDDTETGASLRALRRELTKGWRAGTPWQAREAMEVLSILDLPTWAALLCLIDEFPVMHGAIAAGPGSGTRAVGPSAFEFIAENRQIASIRDFLSRLPEALGP